MGRRGEKESAVREAGVADAAEHACDRGDPEGKRRKTEQGS
jgi:hypothetical protein